MGQVRGWISQKRMSEHLLRFEIRRTPVRHVLDLGRGQRSMTMNEPYRSVASTTPLDLRTTNREGGLGSSSSSSSLPVTAAGCDRTTASDRVPDAADETSTSAGSRVAEHRAHAPTTSGSETPLFGDTNSHRRHGGPVARRTLDKTPSSSLPLRKRPFRGEAETLMPPSLPPDTGHRVLSPAETTDTTRGASECFKARVTDERRVDGEAVAAAKHSRLEPPTGPLPDGFPPGHAHAFNSYAGYPHLRYSHFLPVLVDPRVPPPYLPAEDALVSNVAMAMQQDEDGDAPLHIAVAQKKEAIVHKLINIMAAACKNLNIYNNLRQTPLHLAVITQQEGLVMGLLRAGADPASLDRHGRTALHLCCEYGHTDCLAAVLSHGSSSSCLDLTHFEGLSSLHIAVQGGHKDLARMLLEAGADINTKDIKSGQSPLMYAVESNNVDMVHFLIESGSHVNSQSNSGNTALHSACGRGQLDTVWLLLKNGADSGIKNNHNDTPVMVAKSKKIADVLRGKSSKMSRSQDQSLAALSSRNRTASESSSPNQSPNFPL